MTTFGDGVYQYGGVPVGGAKYSNPFATHWFVDGENGSAHQSGKKPTEALDTIDGAVQKMGVGDVLYIKPQAYVVATGHARYTECATIDLAQSDLSIIGTGYPRSNEFGVRMKATSTEVYCFDISGPSCHIENIGLFSDGTATNTLLARNNGGTNTQRGSDGITLYNVNSKGDPLKIQGGQAARVIDCVFYNAAYQLIIADSGVSGYNQQIRGCSFLNSNGTAPTHPPLYFGGANVYGLWVDHCFFGEAPTTAAYFIQGGAAQSDGIISNCVFDTVNLDWDDDVSLGGGAIYMVGCYDQTGLVDGTAD